jgi:hypothetical protein
MKRFATVFFALGLATAGSTTLAAQPKDQINTQGSKPQPVKMTDAQMDGVAGGLIDVYVIDVANNVLNNNDVRVAIPINAAVAAGVLGTGVAVPTQVARFGRQP